MLMRVLARAPRQGQSYAIYVIYMGIVSWVSSISVGCYR